MTFMDFRDLVEGDYVVYLYPSPKVWRVYHAYVQCRVPSHTNRIYNYWRVLFEHKSGKRMLVSHEINDTVDYRELVKVNRFKGFLMYHGLWRKAYAQA